MKINKRMGNGSCAYVCFRICLVRDFENLLFFFLKMLLAVLLLKRKTRLGERSSSALLHFAAGGGHPLEPGGISLRFTVRSGVASTDAAA